MQSYINHLIDDIRAAHRPPEPPALTGYKDGEQLFEEHIAEVERFIHEDPTITLSEHCGLKPHAFPPAARLTDDQIVQVIEAFGEMLYTYNIHAHFPEGAPARLCYPHLLGLLDTKMFIDREGYSGYDFCDYNPPTCPFGEWCSCKDPEDEEDTDSTKKGADWPF